MGCWTPRVLGGAGLLKAERVSALSFSLHGQVLSSGPLSSGSVFRTLGEAWDPVQGDVACRPPACKSAALGKYSGPACLPTCGFTVSSLIRATVVPGYAGQAGLLAKAHLELTGQPGGLLPTFSGGLRHNAGGWGAWGTFLPAQGPAQRPGDLVEAAATSWRNGLSPSTVSQGQA